MAGTLVFETFVGFFWGGLALKMFYCWGLSILGPYTEEAGSRSVQDHREKAFTETASVCQVFTGQEAQGVLQIMADLSTSKFVPNASCEVRISKCRQTQLQLQLCSCTARWKAAESLKKTALRHSPYSLQFKPCPKSKLETPARLNPTPECTTKPKSQNPRPARLLAMLLALLLLLGQLSLTGPQKRCLQVIPLF